MEHQEEKQQPFSLSLCVILITAVKSRQGLVAGRLLPSFGIYELFLANLTKNFKENILYFIR